MDIDRIIFDAEGKLTEEEKQFRKDNGLCRRCGLHKQLPRTSDCKAPSISLEDRIKLGSGKTIQVKAVNFDDESSDSEYSYDNYFLLSGSSEDVTSNFQKEITSPSVSEITSPISNKLQEITSPSACEITSPTAFEPHEIICPLPIEHERREITSPADQSLHSSPKRKSFFAWSNPKPMKNAYP